MKQTKQTMHPHPETIAVQAIGSQENKRLLRGGGYRKFMNTTPL